MLPLLRYILPYTILPTLLIGAFSCPARAVEWKELASTSRHQVALDEDSVRLTPPGRLAIWLRFTPLGDTQRKAAAIEYGEKGYRSHLEYYEINCDEQSAVLGLIDIFGTGKARLKRINGDIQPDVIIPGSVLDRAAQQICPELDEVSEEEAEVPIHAVSKEIAAAPEQPTPETRQKILELVKRAAAEPANHEAWSLLGNACFDANLPKEAIAAYNKALELKPDDTNILNDQGAMFREIGEFSSALANFEKAVKIDPYNLESLYNIGYVYAFDLNNIPKALQIWKRYLELEKSSETARQVQSFVDRYQKDAN